MSTKSDAQIQIADNILAGLTDEQRAILGAAHWRYVAFAAGLPDEQFQEQAKADRQAYSHLLQQSAVGLSVLSPDRAAQFMVAVTGMERDWCVAWAERDFYLNNCVVIDEESV
jgi:hypothetical protein